MFRTILHCSFTAALTLSLLAMMPTDAHAQSDTRIGLRNLSRGNIPFANRFSSAINISKLQNPASDPLYPGYIASEYNMVSPENELKPAWIWQGPGRYNTAAADFLLGRPGSSGWARANGVAVRGHTLVYPIDTGYTNPTWLLNNEASITPAQARQYLRDYIHFIAGRYKGKVAAWDVINECISDGTTANEYNLRNNFWYRKLGKDFLLYACQYAYEADPNTELYINDYNVETINRKSSDHLNLVKWLRTQTNSDGTPIKVGIGLQYHISVNRTITPGDSHYQVCQRLQDENIPFQITELDVSMPVSDGTVGITPVNPADLNRQATVYRRILTMAKSFPNCRGFQTWGAHDGYSWIPSFFAGNGAALPADANYQPKPAYWAMQEVLGRTIPDGTYSLAVRGATSQVLTTKTTTTPSLLALAPYTGLPTQKWRVTWMQNRGTYRLAPVSDPAAALDTYAWNSYPLGGLQTYSYWNQANNQEWLITPTSDGFYSIAPRTSINRVVGTRVGVTTTTPVGITFFDKGLNKQWLFQAR